MTAAGTGPGTREDQDRVAGVREMFSAIAPTYDLLNALLSFGADRRWREEAARSALAGLEPGSALLDVATGTGDLALAVARRRPDVRVVAVDFAAPMLELARRKALGRGVTVDLVLADGTALPFPDASFDTVTIAYGLRNFGDVAAGLREFRRVLKPGGRLVVLEFPPPPAGPFGALFRCYFTRLLPRLGGTFSGAPRAYAYLPSSVLAFLTPEELRERLLEAGFERVEWRLQTFGVSALHVADAGRGPAGRWR